MSKDNPTLETLSDTPATGSSSTNDPTNPDHYEGRSGMQAIDVIEDFGLDGYHNLAQAVHYILRCNKKSQKILDIKKAMWFLNRELTHGKDPSHEAETKV